MLHRLPAVARRSGRLIPVQHGKGDAEQDDQRIQSVRAIASFFFGNGTGNQCPGTEELIGTAEQQTDVLAAFQSAGGFRTTRDDIRNQLNRNVVLPKW